MTFTFAFVSMLFKNGLESSLKCLWSNMTYLSEIPWTQIWRADCSFGASRIILHFTAWNDFHYKYQHTLKDDSKGNGWVQHNEKQQDAQRWCWAWCESAVEKQIQHAIWKIILKKIRVRIQVFVAASHYLSYHDFNMKQWKTSWKITGVSSQRGGHSVKEKPKITLHVYRSYVQETLTVITGLYPHNILKSEGTSLFFKRTVEQIMQGTLYNRQCGEKSS